MVPELYALCLFLMASNSARFGCWISKWRLRLYSFGIETALRQPKHSTFEFTTVNKYLFVHFELNTLPLFFYFFSCFQSSWYATQEHNKCLPTNKLKVKMLVKTTHAVDSSGTHIPGMWKRLFSNRFHLHRFRFHRFRFHHFSQNLS